MKLSIAFAIVFTAIISSGYTQNKEYKIRTIAFYNLENLFDTINNPHTFDDERTPQGKYHYTSKVYWDKIDKLAKVISEIGTQKTKTSPAIIGVAEIENRAVLEDLIHSKHLKYKQYDIVHYDSPDRRGIDVALLYQRKYFKPTDHEIFELKLWNEKGVRYYTRDQLLVSGYLDDELIHIIVNHWPSRRGGQAKSNIKREKAAQLNLNIIERLQKENPKAKIITMGDLNDDPTDKSLKNILQTKGDKKSLEDEDLFNPMENMFKKGLNTLGYRDKTNLFDQILMTSPFVTNTSKYSDFKFYQSGIYNPKYLITRSGRFKGYPFRSYANGNYTGGYSDHFPVYIYLIKEK